MAYQTDTNIADVNALISAWAAFLTANGWTANRNAAAGSGRELCVSKGSIYANMRAFDNETITINGSGTANRSGIAINGSDGYGAGDDWDRQPGYPVRSTTSGGDQGHALMPLITSQGPFPSYHFFAHANAAYMELEITTSAYVRLGFGALDTVGATTPTGEGRFYYATGGSHPSTGTWANTWLGSDVDNGSYALEMVPFRLADYANSSWLSGSAVRCSDGGSFNGWAGSARTDVGTYLQAACAGNMASCIRDLSPNPINGVGVMESVLVCLNVANTYMAPIGEVPGIRYIDMTNYAPGEEFALGSDVWKVFPWYAKGGLSRTRGIAHLKVL